MITRRTIITGALALPVLTMSDAMSQDKRPGPEIADALEHLLLAINSAIDGHKAIVEKLGPILGPPGPLADVYGPRVHNPTARAIHSGATMIDMLHAMQSQLLGRIPLL